MKIEKHIETILREQTRRGIDDEVYTRIASMTDLTSLDGRDNNQTIKELCERGRSIKNKFEGLTNIAAICVYPVFVSLVRESLSESGIATACVAGAFPSGHLPLYLKLEEIKYAIQQGAEEVDMVISRGKMIGGETAYIREEVESAKALCGKEVLLKVILETGELSSEHLIRHAARIAMESGADFIKTSTGKSSPAATPEAFYYMLDEIRKYHSMSNRMIGIKAAGGIRDAGTALNYYYLTDAVLGEKWLHKRYFRFGASSLIDDLYRTARGLSKE